MKIGALSTIHVEYNVPDTYTLEEARNEILPLLESIAHDAASEGRLSGFTEFTVNKWWSKTAIIVGPETPKATSLDHPDPEFQLQVYECPSCGGHVGIDATFLGQVQPAVTLTCPYCHRSMLWCQGDNV